MPDEPSPRPGQGLWRQLLRSVLRHGGEDTPHNRVAAVTSNLWLHLHPPRVPARALRFGFTLCAGGIALLAFLVTLVSGLVLMLYYRPTTLQAHADVLALTQEVPLGAFLRGLHRYAGDLLVIAVLVHMIRVLLAGAYRPPREFNWVVGVGLLLLTLATAFTGYLLPWTEHGYWATTVASNMLASAPLVGADGPLALVGPEHDLRAALLGGHTVAAPTLVRFYVLHCVALPLAAALLMGLHFWRVRKDGISEPL